MTQDLLNNITTEFICGTFIIKAAIDRTNPLSTHLSAIDVLCEIDGEQKLITSLDPWKSKIEFRHRQVNPRSHYCLAAKITNNEYIFSTDWFSCF